MTLLFNTKKPLQRLHQFIEVVSSAVLKIGYEVAKYQLKQIFSTDALLSLLIFQKSHDIWPGLF